MMYMSSLIKKTRRYQQRRLRRIVRPKYLCSYDIKTSTDLISWTGDHAEVFLSNLIAKERLIRHAQSHVENALTSKFHGVLGGQQPRYDGIAQFWVENEGDLIAVFTSDYYRTVVYVGDCQVKWDKESSEIPWIPA